MSKYYILTLINLINCCSYPDIDSVPKYNTLNITMQESIDLCIIANNTRENKVDCYKEINEISNGL